MRPLIITPLYPPAVGGAATYFGGLAPKLAEHERIESLVVLTESMAGQPRERAGSQLRVLRYLPARISLAQRPWLMHAVTYVMTELWFARHLLRMIARHQVSLVHFHTRYRGRLLYNALKRSHVPVIADLRDKMTDPALITQTADRLLCCGEGIQRFAIGSGFPAERAVLIPNAFEVPGIPPPDRVHAVRRRYDVDRGPYLLFLGDITANKGVYDLLEAYRRWQPEHPQVRLVFAGLNLEGKRFRDELQRADGAVYVGYVPHETAMALLRGAEIMILPSRSEGLPTVILEAIALGTKVICPPGIPEFERHLAQFVLPRVDEDAIVDALNAAWPSSVLPSYPFSEHSVSRVVEALVKVYDQVLRERSVPAPASGGWHADRPG